MLKAVIFDMDGVLVNSEPIYYEIEKKHFKSLGLEISDEEHQSFQGMTSVGMWSELKEKYGMSQSVDELVMQGGKLMRARLEQEKDLRPVRGVEAFLQDLEKNEVKLVLGTSASRWRMDYLLALLHLEKYFQWRVCAVDIINGKPAPDIFLCAAEKAGVDPAECVVIEDSRNGVLAAKAAGMKCIGYDNSGIKQDLSGADLVIDDFEQISYQKIVTICG